MKLALSLLKPQIGPTVVVKQTDDYEVEDFSPESPEVLSRTGSVESSLKKMLAALSRNGSQNNLSESSPPQRSMSPARIEPSSKSIVPYGSRATLGFPDDKEAAAGGDGPPWTPEKLDRQISDLQADIAELKVLAPSLCDSKQSSLRNAIIY